MSCSWGHHPCPAGPHERCDAPTGLPGQGDGSSPLIYLTKAPRKVGQPAVASRPGCGPLAGPRRDGARHGRTMRQRCACRTGHPMKGGLGPGCGREARRYPMAAGPSRPNERNSASAGGSRSGPSISAAVCGDGPRWGEAGSAAGAGARAGLGPAPRGGLPPPRLSCLQQLIWRVGKCPWIYSLPSTPGMRVPSLPGMQVPSRTWLPSSSGMLLGPASWQRDPWRVALCTGRLALPVPPLSLCEYGQLGTGKAGTGHRAGRWRSLEQPSLGKRC